MADLGFQLMDDDSMKDLLEDVDSINTKKQIKYAIGRLEMYEKFSGKKAPVSSAAELDKFLGKFYASLRQQNGELYQKKSMQAIRYGLQKHLSAFGHDIVEGAEFGESNKYWKAMMIKLKKAGKGSV